MTKDTETTWHELGEFVTKTMQKAEIPGLALGLLQQGEISTASFGVTNVDHPLPITDETLFQIGSISKTFLGTAVMSLVEMGKLDLDVPIRQYVPEFKVMDERASAQATVRHLLTHTSGWVGDYFDDTGRGDDALGKYVNNMANLEQLAPLGTVWSYNNAGFSLAGYVIEQVTGQSFETAMKELLLEPMGLKTAYLNPTEAMPHRFVVGHTIEDEGAQVARPWPLPRAVNPAGGIICHLQDLLRYARFQLGDGLAEDGTRLLTKESITQMQSPQLQVWGDEGWGLTWRVDDTNGVQKISHSGGTVGQITFLILIPEHQFALAVLTNANRGGVVTNAVSNWVQQHYLGLPDSTPTPLEAPIEDLKSYVGRYSRPFAEIELGILGNKLIGQVTYKGGFPTKDTPPSPSPPPATLDLCEKDRLLILDGPLKHAKVDVVRRADGSIGWLRAGSRLHTRQA